MWCQTLGRLRQVDHEFQDGWATWWDSTLTWERNEEMENKELCIRICMGSVPIQHGQGQTPHPNLPVCPPQGRLRLADWGLLCQFQPLQPLPISLVKSLSQRFTSGRGGVEHPGEVSEIALLGTVHEHAGFFEGKREEWRHLIWGNLTMIERNGVGRAGGLYLRLLVIWENGPLNKS